MRTLRSRLSCLLSALILGSLAAPAAAAPARGPAFARSTKLQGGLPLAFVQRPATDGSGGMVPAASMAPVTIHFVTPPLASDLTTLRSLGVIVARGDDGAPRGYDRFVIAELPASAVDAVAALARVEKIVLDGSPFPAPPPLDVTAAEIQATDVWRSALPDGTHLTGAGITICDIDSGIDIFHPLFFRADGGAFAWVDVDGDGLFTPGVDGIDLDGSGTPVVLKVQDSVITNFYDNDPRFDSDNPGFDISLDYLYADANGNGTRDFGPAKGFLETDPTYGERLFVADDVNHNGKLDLGEKIVALGTSKIRTVRTSTNKTFRRGKDLIQTPVTEDAGHGSGASSILAGGNRGFGRLVGIAPDAELIMTSSQGALVKMADFCVSEGSRVVLHEYAPWVGYHLDGSSPMEKLIDTTALKTGGKGVSHINPAGNLSTSRKLYKHSIAAGAETVVKIDVPASSPYGDFTFFGTSMLWRDKDRKLALTLEGPDGFSMAIPTDGTQIQTIWQGTLTIAAALDVSDRGTSRVDIYLFGEKMPLPPIPTGTWKLHVVDSTPAGATDMPLIGYVQDELSGWGLGIAFPELSSEEHLIGYPGTADHGIAVSAYTGRDFDGDTVGERAYYSGRGHRIDGEPLLWISAPDNPISAGYATDDPDRLFIFGGTSGASPHVAGAAALLMQADPTRTGEDVKQAIKKGAFVDAATGKVPNDDFGNGKLRVYESLYGKAPPGGSAPELAIAVTTAEPGKEATVVLDAKDADEPTANLLFDLDREYDGAYEERLKAPSFPVKYDAEGTYRVKVRVTDSTGREAAALAVIEVKKATIKPPVDKPKAVEEDSGGCGSCRTSASSSWTGAWPALAGLLAFGLRRRRASIASIR
jgi:subtilisin family serine protease